MIRIRGGSGLGDAIYLRPIAEHLIRCEKHVMVLTDYTQVFIGSGVVVEAYRRHHVEMVAHYTGRKTIAGTSLFEDMCIHAGLPTTIPLRFKWEIRNQQLVSDVRRAANGRPIVLVHGGREPMGRTDKFGIELMPTPEAMCGAVEALVGCFTVRVGKGAEIYSIPVDADYTNRTNVSDLLDLFRICDGVVAQCSFAIPAAEVFDRPLLAVWSRRAQESREMFIRTVTPSKILSKPTSRAVYDDCLDEVAAAASGFMKAGA